MGTGFVALLVAGALSLATISLAWLFYRPLVGLPLLALGIGIVTLLIMRLMKQTPASSAQQFVDRPYNGTQEQGQSNETSIGV